MGLFVVEGEKGVSELLASHVTVRTVYTTEALASQHSGPTYVHVSPKELERISGLTTPNKVLAIAEKPKEVFDRGAALSSLVIALDDVRDPGNMGTIMRLADWFGITDILCSKTTVEAFNPKVIQASMGASFRIHVHYVNLEEELRALKAASVPVYAATMEGEDALKKEFHAKGVLILGNEARGISPAILNLADHYLFIPGSGKAESLNVAMAGAILVAQFYRGSNF